MARVLSQGTIITMDCGSGATEIGCITSFSTPASNRSEINVTCLSSDAQEFRLGLVDNGTVSLNIIFDDCDAGQEDLTDQLGSDEPCEFVITFSGGTTVTFDALVQSFQLDGSIDSAVTGTVTLRVTGESVFNFVCNSA